MTGFWELLLTIEPHDGDGGLLPRPRNDSDASVSTANAKFSEARTISGAVRFGKMCRESTRSVGAPRDTAASTYVVRVSDSVEPRTTRMKVGVVTMPIASMTFGNDDPSMAMMAIASRIVGKANKTSITSVSSPSSQPPR